MAKTTPGKAKKAASLQQGCSTPSNNLTEEDRSTPSTKRNGSASSREINTSPTAPTSSSSNGNHDKSNGKQQQQTPTTPQQQQQRHSKGGILLRSLLLDMPLLVLFSMYVSIVVLHYVYDEYLVPQAELMRWNEARKTCDMSYYDRTCTLDDISANTTAQLLITPQHSPEQCMHHIAKHGISLYPNVLSNDTANELRDWILERNKIDENFWVISGEHRYTFGIGVNQAPIVSKALQEIASHTLFRPAIKEICGDNPAVIEFTAITRYVRLLLGMESSCGSVETTVIQ